jgi:hypothetical protein
MLSPKLANDDWLNKKGIVAYMRKNKMGDIEPPSHEEIASIRNQYTKDTSFYTDQIEPDEAIEVKEYFYIAGSPPHERTYKRKDYNQTSNNIAARARGTLLSKLFL